MFAYPSPQADLACGEGRVAAGWRDLFVDGIGAVGAGQVLAHPEIQSDRCRIDACPLPISEVGQQGAKVVEGKGDDARGHAVQEVGDTGGVRIAVEFT